MCGQVIRAAGAMWVDEVFTSCKIRERSAVTFVF